MRCKLDPLTFYIYIYISTSSVYVYVIYLQQETFVNLTYSSKEVFYELIFFNHFFLIHIGKKREKLLNILNVINFEIPFFLYLFSKKDFSQIINGNILIAIWFNLKLKSFSYF